MVIRDYKFQPGDLVLLRHTAIESSLDKKMKPRYNGPMIVVRENKGGSYILAEMTGTVLPFKCAKFRVIPYFARKNIPIPEGIMNVINLSKKELDDIDALPDDDAVLTRDYLMDGVHMESDLNIERRERDIEQIALDK